MERERALLAAREIGHVLRPACQKLAQGGSIRREVADVGDIEIVALPIFTTADDLFEQNKPCYDYPLLEQALHKLLAEGLLKWDDHVVRRGPWYKRFIVVSLDIPLDLYLTKEQNFGNQLFLRTGNVDFTRALVTPVYRNGLLPNDLRHEEGYLRYKRTGLFVPCPTEADFFHALRLPVLPAKERDRDGVERLREIAARGGVST